MGKSVDPAFNLGCGRLTPLNKMPRVQAQVDEVLRRIIGKAVMRIATMGVEAVLNPM